MYLTYNMSTWHQCLHQVAGLRLLSEPLFFCAGVCHCLSHLKELDFWDVFWVFGCIWMYLVSTLPRLQETGVAPKRTWFLTRFQPSLECKFEGSRLGGLFSSFCSLGLLDFASLASVIEAWKTMAHERPFHVAQRTSVIQVSKLKQWKLSRGDSWKTLKALKIFKAYRLYGVL